MTETTCRHQELVDSIITWSGAYPLAVFPEPDWDSIDPIVRSQVSASMGRHVIGRLMELISDDEKRP